MGILHKVWLLISSVHQNSFCMEQQVEHAFREWSFAVVDKFKCWKKVMLRIVRGHQSDGQSSWRRRMSLGMSQSVAKIVRTTLAWTLSRARASAALALLCHTGQAYSIIGLTYVTYRWHVSLAGSWWDTWTGRNSPARLRDLVRIDSRSGLPLEVGREDDSQVFVGVYDVDIYSSSIDKGNCWHAFMAGLPSGRTTVLAGEKRPLQDWAQADAADTLDFGSSARLFSSWLSFVQTSGICMTLYSLIECCIAGNFRQRKISSKATVRQFVRNLFSSNAGRRSFALRSFGRHSFACRLSSHSWIFLIPHLLFVKKKCSQEFNLVKKLLWRKRMKLNSWRKFPAIQ